MEKHYLVPQPPIANKYAFLVDETNNNRNFGRVTDINKFKYNRELLGSQFNIDIDIHMPLTEKGMSLVMPIGRFITIIEIKRDETQGRMTFFDYEIRMSREEMHSAIRNLYSENITNEWFKYYELMNTDFREEDDNVILVNPDEN